MRPTFSLKLAALGLATAFCMSAPLAPASADEAFEDVSRVSILPGWLRADGFYMAAVQVDLAPGWKTYWRSPGDNGIAPIFDWSGSDNLAQVGYFWPSPKIMDERGIRTIGYKEQLILPVLMKLRNPQEPLNVRLKMDYGVCDDICLPARSKAHLSVDRGQVLNQDTIETAMELQSVPAASMGLQSSTCGLTAHEDAFVLNAEFTFDGDVDPHRLVIVETGSDQIWVSEADHAQAGGTVRVEADLHYFGDGAMTLDRTALRFTMLNDGQSVEISGCSGG